MRYSQVIEWVATLVESMVIISIVATISGKNVSKHHNILVIFAAVCLTALTGLLNAISAFSFLTPVIAILFILLLPSRMLTAGPWLLRCLACVIAYFVVLTIDYILFILFGLFGLSHGWSESAFSMVMALGTPRSIFLVVDKSLDVLLYLLFKKFLAKLQDLKRNYQLALLFICLLSYITVQYMFSVFIDDSIELIYTTYLISWLYILCFFTAVMALFALLTRAEQEKQTHTLLEATNQMLMTNYQQLHTYQQNYAKQSHDFKHHIAALKGLTSMGKYGEASAYVDSLLTTAYKETALCHSGSDIIDAIINCKAAEAAELEIVFNFGVQLHAIPDIAPVDICGALANQIDNAFDACLQIPASLPREINVIIKQVENFMFFRVENTVDHDPFRGNTALISTKKDTAVHHGLGLKNIREIAEKYNGSLRNEYRDGYFVSVVSLCYEPFDT